MTLAFLMASLTFVTYWIGWGLGRFARDRSHDRVRDHLLRQLELCQCKLDLLDESEPQAQIGEVLLACSRPDCPEPSWRQTTGGLCRAHQYRLDHVAPPRVEVCRRMGCRRPTQPGVAGARLCRQHYTGVEL